MRIRKSLFSVSFLVFALGAEARNKAGSAASSVVFSSPATLKTTNQGMLDLDTHTGLTHLSSGAIIASPRGGETSELLRDVLSRLKIAAYFALWYALNIVYNSMSWLC